MSLERGEEMKKLWGVESRNFIQVFFVLPFASFFYLLVFLSLFCLWVLDIQNLSVPPCFIFCTPFYTTEGSGYSKS